MLLLLDLKCLGMRMRLLIEKRVGLRVMRMRVRM